MSICTVRDVTTSVWDHSLVSPGDLSHKVLLRATHNLREHERMMSDICNNLHHLDGLLDELDLSLIPSTKKITVAGRSRASTGVDACQARQFGSRRWERCLGR